MAGKWRLKRLVLLALALLLWLFAAACGSQGQDSEQSEAEETAPIDIPAPTPIDQPKGYEQMRIYFDGLLSDKGYYHNDTAYIALDSICDFYGLSLSVQDSEDEFSISLSGVDIKGVTGQQYIVANHRYLYTPKGVLKEDGRIYLPHDAVERIFDVDIKLCSDPVRADVSTAGYNLINGGENYYDTSFPVEDLFWLSRIIYAEAGNQPLEGMIGVGNVVLNRLKSPDFPNTVFEVIYDRRGVIQFTPAATGAVVLADPSPEALIAAYICLEGYSTVGDSLYFVNPTIGDNTWFKSALNHVITIGDHEFYA